MPPTTRHRTHGLPAHRAWRRGLRRMLPAAIAAALVLSLAGVGAAQAGWSTTASTTAFVTSGTLSVAQSGANGLTVTYGPSLSKTVPITVTNGAIPARYTLALQAADTSSDLAGAITLLTWPVPTAATGCAAVPQTVTSSTWAAGATLEGDLAANGTAFWCVRTSLPTASYNTSQAERSVAVQSVLSARAGEFWTSTKTTQPVTQTVPADTTAPAQPTGLTVSGVTDAAATLTWTADPDAASYVLSRDGIEVHTITGNTVTDTGLTVGTNYSYTVQAIDAAGNRSAMSVASSITTSTQTDAGIYQISIPGSGLCLTGGATVGSLVTVADCAPNTTAQEWKFAAAQSTLASQAAAELNVRRGNKQDDLVRVGGNAGGTNAEKWSTVWTSSGTVVIQNDQRCLTTSVQAGTLTMAECQTSQASQQFTLTRVG